MSDDLGNQNRSGYSGPQNKNNNSSNNSNNNPHGSPSASHAASTVPPESQSVVSKLMQIYESMTQSSTPQNPNEEFTMEDSHDHHRQQQQQQQQQLQQQHVAEHEMPYYHHPAATYGFLAPEGSYFAGLPPGTILSAPYQHHTTEQPTTAPPSESSFARNSPEVPEPNEPVVSLSSSRSLRKRNIEKIEKTAGSDTSINSSNNGGGGGSSSARGSKSRKKAKETDARWSKRFTWPDDLHRDFVSAIFDVGLKHSSPSAIMEQMPKHEQITSERVKSHLQKYRLHRNKSKKEFMASYDTALSKLRSNKKGVDDPNVKAFAGGEVGAHLSYLIITEGESGDVITAAVQDEQPQQQQQQQQRHHDGQAQDEQLQDSEGFSTRDPGPDSTADTNATSADPNVTIPHEALMLPRLDESEKRSPIGTSMGYLMGLFFSLKEQLMAQRAAAAAAEAAATAAAVAAAAESGSPTHVPVNAVYDAFSSSCADAVGPGGGGWGIVADASQHLVTFAQGAGGSGGDVSGTPAASGATSAAAAAAASGAPSCRSNLEESTLMKREMQNQMAFQNKMRALKQHELEKYKNAHHNFGMTFHDTEQKSDGIDQHGMSLSYRTEDEDRGGMTSHVAGGNGSGSGSSEMGHSNSQGAGETAMDPSMLAIGGGGGNGGQRHRGLSVGGSDEFWTSDVVDEQLFEFLMNN